jgi:hypothetical protein
MRQSIGVLFALTLAGGLLAACNSGNNSVPPGTGTACGNPPNQLELLEPIPGSRNANPALGALYVATKGPLPPSNQYNFQIVQSNGSSTYTSTFYSISASQIPSPSATPSYPNPTYYATSLPSSYIIGPGQSVSLLWNDGGTGCTPRSQVASFRTKG